MSPALREGFAGNHTAGFQAAQSLGKERARNERNAAMDVVEMLRPGEHLAQNDWCPALREHLACHCHGADLTESGFHSSKPIPKSLMILEAISKMHIRTCTIAI